MPPAGMLTSAKPSGARSVNRISVLFLAIAFALPAAAQDKSIKILVGFPAGAGLGAAELARIHRADYDKWGPVIKASGFKPES